MRKLIILMVIALSFGLFSGCGEDTTKNESPPSNNADVEQDEQLDEQGIITTSFTVYGMVCEANCAKRIEKVLSETEGVINASVDFEGKLATVKYDSDITDEDIIKEHVTNMGFNVE